MKVTKLIMSLVAVAVMGTAVNSAFACHPGNDVEVSYCDAPAYYYTPTYYDYSQQVYQVPNTGLFWHYVLVQDPNTGAQSWSW